MTKEYGCAYWHDHADEATALISTGPAETFDVCTSLCMANPLCESVKWTEAMSPMVSECKLYSQSWDTNDKTCSIPDVIGGRKCHRQGSPPDFSPDSVRRMGQIRDPCSANENANHYIVICVLNMVILFMKDVPLAWV